MDQDMRRARVLIEESREAIVVLDDADTVILASRRARQTFEGIVEGDKVPSGLLSGDAGVVPLMTSPPSTVFPDKVTLALVQLAARKPLPFPVNSQFGTARVALPGAPSQ